MFVMRRYKAGPMPNPAAKSTRVRLIPKNAGNMKKLPTDAENL